MGEDSLEVIPTKVEGLENVSKVIFYKNKIEFYLDNNKIKEYHYKEIAKYKKPKWLIFLRRQLGLHTLKGIVAYRDWTKHDFMFFNNNGYIKVYIPFAKEEQDYITTTFFKIQQIIGNGGYNTLDMS